MSYREPERSVLWSFFSFFNIYTFLFSAEKHKLLIRFFSVAGFVIVWLKQDLRKKPLEELEAHSLAISHYHT